MNKLAIDHEYVSRRIIEFMRREVRNSGFEKVILGLSGGIDSSLVAFLAKEAFGKKNVHGVIMPYRTSSPKSEEDALKVAEAAKISWEKVEITNMVDSYFSFFPDASPLRKGNRMARERMCILYDLSARDRSLVMGTGNKTEMYLGYSTQYGDAACALLPIADLYKTQVWSLSEYLGVPKEVIEKIADLCNDSIEHKTFERLSPLSIIGRENIEKGDAVIAFSRRDVLDLKTKIEKKGLSVAVIYGGLPPEVRVNQSKLFNSGKKDVLVASDAIGYGLNLNIKRILFSTLLKFNGNYIENIDQTTFNQIAGRAGRYGRENNGLVGYLMKSDESLFRLQADKLHQPLPPLKNVYYFPEFAAIEKLSKQMKTNSLNKILYFYQKIFTNGYDLRNKYSHGTNTQSEQKHKYDYYLILKIIILILLKIEDDIIINKNTTINNRL